MPSSNQHNEQAAAIPNPNPALAERYGENPARFLVEDLQVDGGNGTTGELSLARIQGLESVELCNYWLAIERRLAAQEGRDPRDLIVDALEERAETLRKRGEGHATTGMTPAERRERSGDLPSESVAVLLDEDGNEVDWSRQRGAVVGASR